MFFKALNQCFNSDHIAIIERIQNRDPSREPVQYRIEFVGLAKTVVVNGEDVAPFEAWLKKECSAYFPKPETKPDDVKKVA